MLKRLTFLAFALALISSSYAYVQILSPVDAKLEAEAVVSAGAVQPSETFELVFSRESGVSGAKWDSLNADLPDSSWLYSAETQDRSFLVKITVPESAKENIYRTGFTLSNRKGLIAPQTSYVSVAVKKGLLEFRKRKLLSHVEAGNPMPFEIEIENGSVAPHTLRITSGLSNAWFMPLTETIEAGSTKTISVDVIPRTAGITKFSFRVESLHSGREIAVIEAEIEAKPSLIAKLSSSAYSMPFLDFALLPQRFLVSLIASFFG
jgi:hypothetical protein